MGYWVRRGTEGIRVGICFAVALGVTVAASHGQTLVDDDTLVLMNFDGTVQPDYTKGTGSVELRGGQLAERGGRFGDGLWLDEGGGLELVGNDGNFNPAAGTIAFWIKPSWPGSDEAKHSLCSARVGEGEYLNINTLGKGRLGIAMAAGTGDDFRWRRADGDASGWEAETWHHVAFAWGEGVLSVFLDGEEDTKGVTDSHMLRGLPEKLVLFGANAVIDDFQVYNRRFEAGDVAESIDRAMNPPTRMLDTLSYEASEDVERSGMTILGDVELPLVLGDARCSRGFSMGDGGELTFAHDGSSKWLCVTVGLSAFAPAAAECHFGVWGDDERLFVSDASHRDDEPVEIRVDLTGKRRVQLKVAGRGMRHGEAVWAYPRLTNTKEGVPIHWGHALSEKRLAMYRRQVEADDFRCTIDLQEPWIVCAKHWADDVNVSDLPQVLSAETGLAAAAAPGEYEPVNFMVYAIDEAMANVRVSVSDLKGDMGAIAAGACDVRLVLRRLMRDIYTFPPERSTVVSRFLLANQPVAIPAGTFREYHVIVRVPEDQAPGVYGGVVTIETAAGDRRIVPLVLNVRPVKLGLPAPNQYGMYYRFPSDESEWPGCERELVDIYEHGGRMLKSNLGVDYALGENGVIADVGRLRRGLGLLAKHGYKGPMPISTGVETVARLLHYDPVADYEDTQAREAFFQAVAKGMQALEALNTEFRQFELMPTHMDEVFGRDRLTRYIRFTEAVQRATDLRVYITLHNDPKRNVGPLMEQIDPFVDVRCYNGHAMDSWIQAGNTFEDLAKEMEASGDEAWLYHNIRGAFFPAEWTRLVNGFYMWVSPIKIHVPWMYYSYTMNPMDCTDGSESSGGDFAYAVPDPDDRAAMIPTRHWEAYREGVDDMRYLRTLERLVEQHQGTPQAERARRWLAELRERLTPSHEELQRIEKESPLLVWLAAEFDGEDYRRFREEASGLIAELQSM